MNTQEVLHGTPHSGNKPFQSRVILPLRGFEVRGQAESVEPNKRPAYRARLIAARRELSGTAGAYIDSILQRLDELSGAEALS